MKRNLKELEHRIGYTFQDFALLKKAMSHSSYVNEEHLPKSVSYTHLTLPTTVIV